MTIRTPWDELPEALHQPLYNLAVDRKSLEAIDAIRIYLVVEHSCTKVVHIGSPNPDSSAFGPDEMCDELALPGSAFCSKHQGSEELT